MDLDSSLTVSIAGKPCYDEETEEDFVGNGKSQATRKIVCRWPDRIALAIALVGGTTSVGGVADEVKGLPYPDFPAMLCTRVKPEGLGVRSVGTHGMIAYELARLTCTYTVPDFSLGGAIIIGDQELDFGSTAIATSSNSPTFKWNDDTDVDASIAPALRYSTINFTQTRYGLADLPIATILGLLDCSNSGSFFGAAAEKVIFIGARSRRQITPAGDTNWAVTYAFVGKGVNGGTWNQLYKPGENTPRNFVFKAGGKLFPPADLNTLFA